MVNQSALELMGGLAVLDRMEDAKEAVRERMLRATAALEASKIPYAVAGGNAVAAWVASVNRFAIRATQDVDILIRRCDLHATISALAPVGLTYRKVGRLDIFLDGPSTEMREAVHIIFAGEKVREHETVPNPDVTESVISAPYRILTLEALVRTQVDRLP